MKQFELPYFGKIDVENITENQEYMSINFQNREITLMWFSDDQIDDIYFKNANDFLTDLDIFDTNNRLLLEKELTNTQDKTVLEYLEYHLEELGEEFTEIIGVSNENSEKLQKLLNALKLNNISFHNQNIVADYVIDAEVSDQILAITINNKEEKIIAWES